MIFPEYISLYAWQDLGLSLRASRALFRAKVPDYAYLCWLDRDELLSIPGIGECTMWEILHFVHRNVNAE